VSSGELLYLLDSEVTSSVQQGEGNGGDVIMDSKMIILNRSWTKANAEEGDGGAVFIQTDNFIKSRESRVTATSRRGNDGTVTIEAPELGIVSGLAVLQADFLDAAQWLAQPCATRCGDTVSRFFIGGRDQTALAPDTIQDSGMFWLDGAEKTR
jgi:large exoprotein involved in heme utilization and adhesion